ncbi:MAG: hypothetical protein LBS19_11095 [Clostridiales bacterium]|jgi:hypothetical protein|nr:hypothetical protein [Clostridiales bacterium]
MTAEQVKAAAKERFGKEITDEQAEKWLASRPDGELTDDELDNVTGGCGGERTPPPTSADLPLCPSCHRKTLELFSVKLRTGDKGNGAVCPYCKIYCDLDDNLRIIKFEKLVK